jgi:hypothetical protein
MKRTINNDLQLQHTKNNIVDLEIAGFASFEISSTVLVTV